MTRLTVRLAELAGLVGTELGVTDWWRVDSLVAADAQYSTLALVGGMWEQLFDVSDAAVKVNYGLDRVRFAACVSLGDRVRMRARLVGLSPIALGVRLHVEQSIELDGSDLPALTALSIYEFRASR
jgi:acyl dehydratase